MLEMRRWRFKKSYGLTQDLIIFCGFDSFSGDLSPLFVYLAAPGLIYGMWDLQSSLLHVISLFAAYELLVVACGI